jgi:hypothetical protein
MNVHESYYISFKGYRETYYSKITFEESGLIADQMLYSVWPDGYILKEGHGPYIMSPEEFVESYMGSELEILTDLRDIFLFKL